MIQQEIAMQYRVLAIMLTAGTPLAAEQAQPQLAPRGTMPSMHVAHIYYNVATGEKIAVPLNEIRPAENGVSPEVWIADNTLPCAALGQTNGTSGVVDSPNCTTCYPSTATGQIFLDWGDIRSDQVVDCVGVTWGTGIRDDDLDGDGLGDGVPGFGATWAWFDAENGFDSSATRLDITGFTLMNLPGFTGSFCYSSLPTYTATIDLAGSFSSSMVFEIGDTDSINSAGTGLFNPGAGIDLDSDGFADFGYAMQYIQPGTFDFDSDGMVDGDPAAQALTGWQLVTGNGDIGTDGAYIPETNAPGAIGIEDAFDVFIDVDLDGIIEPLGTFFYGGFACVGPTGNTPFSQFYMKLYGPGTFVCCGLDIFPVGDCDGLLNFFDVIQFLDWYSTGDPRADIFPYPGDGQFNFFDINQYLAAFAVGCP